MFGLLLCVTTFTNNTLRWPLCAEGFTSTFQCSIWRCRLNHQWCWLFAFLHYKLFIVSISSHVIFSSLLLQAAGKQHIQLEAFILSFGCSVFRVRPSRCMITRVWPSTSVLCPTTCYYCLSTSFTRMEGVKNKNRYCHGLGVCVGCFLFQFSCFWSIFHPFVLFPSFFIVASPLPSFVCPIIVTAPHLENEWQQAMAAGGKRLLSVFTLYRKWHKHWLRFIKSSY